VLEDKVPGLMFDPDQINQDAFTTVGRLIEWIELQLQVENANV
jgi:acyl carrier protein